jgi:glycine/D-amino acid oxidase-like deaminating enzyme
MTSDDRAGGPVPSRAKVVVVGGGIVGCSIAYHLAKMGYRDTVLCERKQLTSGTTWHAAGLVFDLRTRSLTRLGKYAIDLYRSIEDETEQSTGLKQMGRVALALNEARREIVLRSVSLANDVGVEARVISKGELAELWPLLNTDGVEAAAFLPNSARVSPVDATQAFAKGARKYGARVLEHTKVTKILTRNGRVAGVETEAGAI